MAKKITKTKLNKVLKACDVMSEVVNLDVLLMDNNSDVLEDTLTNIDNAIGCGKAKAKKMIEQNRTRKISTVERMMNRSFDDVAQLLVDIKYKHSSVREGELLYGKYKDGAKSGEVALVNPRFRYISEDLMLEQDRECIMAVGKWLPDAIVERDEMIAEVFGE